MESPKKSCVMNKEDTSKKSVSFNRIVAMYAVDQEGMSKLKLEMLKNEQEQQTRKAAYLNASTKFPKDV